MNAVDISAALSSGMGTTVSVRPRRPGLYQINVPAHLADHDGAAVYVRPQADSLLRVSDIGQTSMRLSYSRKIDGDVVDVLKRLAAWHGLTFEGGEFGVLVPPNELVAAMLAMVQVQAAAEATVSASARRRASSERFRQEVRELLQRTFKEACRFDYFDEKSDAQGLWKLDALIHGPRADLGVAIVPSTTEGERAVGTALHVRAALSERRHFMVALPRDINDLPELTRKRLMSEFLVPVPAFEENRENVPVQLEALAG